MKKSRFVEVLKDGVLKTEKEFQYMKKLVSAYPYWSNGYVLMAMNASVFNLDSREFLIEAAIHTPDRSYLKKLIEEGVSQPLQKKDDTLTLPKGVTIGIDDPIFREIEENLQQIEKAKKSFNEYLSAHEMLHSTSDEPHILPPEATIESDNSPHDTPKDEKGELEGQEEEEEHSTIKSYLAQLSHRSEEDDQDASVSNNPLPDSEPEHRTENQELSPEKPSKKDQIKIIEDFIRKAPRLSVEARNLPEDGEDQEDLAEKSQKITDDLLSENLAQIMIKQQKIDKAIEIYRKLIWKFPQKKTYFADQIAKLQEGK